ncbi:MAG TPA: glycerol acyltransferase [Prolixibacteraceae bacterium]|nr:glycerol acyltransferase [Prolixibacteraceae bacterium]
MEGENQQNNFQPIDIRNIISGKNQKLARKIPGFVYRWLSKILHLKELNEIMKNYGQLKGIEFVDETLNYLNLHHELFGIENVPKDQKFIFVGNHPLGGADGGIILKILNENFGDTRCLTNDFLLGMVPPLKDWFVPINKVGTQSRDSLILVEQLYKSNDQILIFPAGLCSRKIKGKIVDLQWQKHFIQKAVEYKKDIIPIFFEGRNSNFFYNLSKIRKFFRIKLNIEMLYLVDELFKHQNKTFKIYIGKPISYRTFDHTKKPLEWASEIKKITYQLPQQVK